MVPRRLLPTTRCWKCLSLHSNFGFEHQNLPGLLPRIQHVIHFVATRTTFRRNFWRVVRASSSPPCFLALVSGRRNPNSRDFAIPLMSWQAIGSVAPHPYPPLAPRVALLERDSTRKSSARKHVTRTVKSALQISTIGYRNRCRGRRRRRRRNCRERF